MMANDFWNMTGPWLYRFAGNASSFTDRLWALGSRDLAVRFVRGARMETPLSLFDEWAAALQFPYYFGRNWDAFDECVTDLSWIDADGYAIAILDSSLMLPHDRDLALLFDTLERAAREWNQATQFRPARPFKVVLHTTDDAPRIAAVLASMSQQLTDLRGANEPQG
jgi:hypothetical protein